jgi:MFS family permease
MPYFVILPVFLVAMCAEGLGLALCALVPKLRRAVPYGWRVLVGSVVGFVTANLASLLVGVVPVLVASALGIDRDHPGAPVVAAFALLGLFLGPLVVSPLGFLGGAWFGWRRAKRAHAA